MSHFLFTPFRTEINIFWSDESFLVIHTVDSYQFWKIDQKKEEK